MDKAFVRRYRLSSREGEGVCCDANGAYVGTVPLLKRSDGIWQTRDNTESPTA